MFGYFLTTKKIQKDSHFVQRRILQSLTLPHLLQYCMCHWQEHLQYEKQKQLSHFT